MAMPTDSPLSSQSLFVTAWAVTTVGLVPAIEATHGLPPGESEIDVAVTSTATGTDTETQPIAKPDPPGPSLLTVTITLVDGAVTVAGERETLHTGTAALVTCGAPESSGIAIAAAITPACDQSPPHQATWVLGDHSAVEGATMPGRGASGAVSIPAMNAITSARRVVCPAASASLISASRTPRALR